MFTPSLDKKRIMATVNLMEQYKLSAGNVGISYSFLHELVC